MKAKTEMIIMYFYTQKSQTIQIIMISTLKNKVVFQRQLFVSFSKFLNNKNLCNHNMYRNFAYNLN